KGLITKLVYVIVANAPSATQASYSDLGFANARKMTTASFPTVNWYSEASGGMPIAIGETVSTETLGTDTGTPGTYDYYVTCCENGYSRDLVSVVVNPVPKLISGQTICSGSSTNIRPNITDINGNPIDETLFPIEYKWTIVGTPSGVESSGITNSDYYQPAMTQTITLAEGYACGEATYSVTARVGGATYSCESNTTSVTVRIVDLSRIGSLDPISECVEKINAATWNEQAEPDADIIEDRPEYKSFTDGSSALDFSTDAIPSDACYSELMSNFEWWITKDSDASTIIYSGTTQPSKILIETDGVKNTIQLHLGKDATKSEAFTIHYQLDVRCGNGLFNISRPITIKPRPTITKMK
ncbi:MAG: hypothetical protein ACK5JS_00005, partial [Mangrovibacterium sp.]